MQIVEHFISIQGEGRYSGVPSIFFRFAKCNLKCAGFGVKNGELIGCDTTRAVYQNNSWKDIKLDELKKILNSYQKTPHVVITGGEPMLHHQDRDFLLFMEHLIEKNFIVTIETNSTINIDFKKYKIYKNIVFAMGVKLSNSNEKESKRININAINNIIKNSKKSFFKFVCDKDTTTCLKEIKNITKQTLETDVYCMPMGVSSLNDTAYKVIDMCIEHGYFYSDRLQVRLWGNEDKR